MHSRSRRIAALCRDVRPVASSFSLVRPHRSILVYRFDFDILDGNKASFLTSISLKSGFIGSRSEAKGTGLIDIARAPPPY